jgi:hypothetical protein
VIDDRLAVLKAFETGHRAQLLLDVVAVGDNERIDDVGLPGQRRDLISRPDQRYIDGFIRLGEEGSAGFRVLFLPSAEDDIDRVLGKKKSQDGGTRTKRSSSMRTNILLRRNKFTVSLQPLPVISPASPSLFIIFPEKYNRYRFKI